MSKVHFHDLNRLKISLEPGSIKDMGSPGEPTVGHHVRIVSLYHTLADRAVSFIDTQRLSQGQIKEKEERRNTFLNEKGKIKKEKMAVLHLSAKPSISLCIPSHGIFH